MAQKFEKTSLSIVLAVILIVIGVLITSVILFVKSQSSPKDIFADQLSPNVTMDPNVENGQMIDTLSKFMNLPKGDLPNIETITVDNIDQAKKQPKFTQVELGDKVVLYKSIAKIIVYRPSTKKIVTTIDIPLTQPPKPPQPTVVAVTATTVPSESVTPSPTPAGGP